MKEKNGRHEIKHLINEADAFQLRARLMYIAKRDKNTQAGNSYLVKSLYFDNYRDKVLKEKMDGTDNREKFRIRLYNNQFDFIRLEKKSKKKGICFKESAVITKEECRSILDGDYEFLKKSGNRLLIEFYAKLYYQQLRPKSIVEYQREAYVYEAGNVRVTIDSHIRSGLYIQDFLNKDNSGIPIRQSIILEVKYDEFLPDIMRDIASLQNRRGTSFSKYAETRVI